MDKDFYYGDKYYYENRIENDISFKFFFFDFTQDINEQLDFVFAHSIDGLSITNTSEDNLKTVLDFILTKKIAVKSLNLQSLTLPNVDFLEHFVDLEILTLIVETKKDFDFSKLKKLTVLNLFYDRFFHSVFTLTTLQSLTLHKLKIKQSSEFSSLTRLSHLEISQCSLSEIIGLSEHKELKTISLRYFPKLDKIEPLTNCNRIESLHFQNCKKVTDWNGLENLSNLETLTIENCGQINSLKWLKKKSIKNFHLIGDTNIQDGDMKWLLETNSIKSINFPVQKHYDLKPEELWTYQREKV